MVSLGAHLLVPDAQRQIVAQLTLRFARQVLGPS